MQGRYEILSLSGSYLLQDTGGGGRLRTGGLSVSLAGTDGRVIGGGVAGLLVAASPIQVAILVDMGYLFFMMAFHVVMSLLHQVLKSWWSEGDANLSFLFAGFGSCTYI